MDGVENSMDKSSNPTRQHFIMNGYDGDRMEKLSAFSKMDVWYVE